MPAGRGHAGCGAKDGKQPNSTRYPPRVAAPDPTELGRKIRQHDNEFEAVYELLTRVDGKVDALDHKVDALEIKVDAGFERTDARIDALDARVDALSTTVTSGFAAVDARFRRLEEGQGQILGLLRELQQGDTTAR